MTRRRAVAAAIAAQLLVVGAVSCGVPTGDTTFEEIDGDGLGGLNDPTTTTTSTTTTTTTTLPDAAPATTTVTPTSELTPTTATASIYFMSRGSLSPITLEIDAAAGLNELIALLEEGPPKDTLGPRLQSFVDLGLIIGTPFTESGVIQVELDGNVFDEISSNNQRQAIAQIVVTLLQNTPAVGQVSFIIDDEVIQIPADSGSKTALSVDDFLTLGAPRSSNEPPDELGPIDVSTTTSTNPTTSLGE